MAANVPVQSRVNSGDPFWLLISLNPFLQPISSPSRHQSPSVCTDLRPGSTQTDPRMLLDVLRVGPVGLFSFSVYQETDLSSSGISRLQSGLTCAVQFNSRV